MIKIRLQRRGRKKRPIHHIVVADSRSPRDGRIIEDLGRFDNVTVKNQLTLDEERAIYWLQQGAQPSDTVRSILRNQGIMYKMHLMRWGKSEEEIEAALDEWREKRQAKADKEPSKKEKQQAMLNAEEKEYQKQLKKKAEEAAREKAKREALAKAEKEAQAKAEKEAENAEEDEAADAEEAPDEQAEAKTEEAEEESVEADDPAEEETAAEPEAQEEAAGEEGESTEEEADKKEEVKTEVDQEEEKESAGEEEEAQTSTDMLAKEAIKHIHNTSLKDLEGFVTDDEDRVTVQRAWEEKQEE